MPNGRILLIDDDRDMISIGEQIFKKADYDFHATQSGKDGLAKMLQLTPDIVILDYLLTDMRADDFIRSVAEKSTYASVQGIPFVILSALEEDAQNLRPLYQMGLKAYLTKPFGHRELKCIIENVIQVCRAEKGRGESQPQAAPEPRAAAWGERKREDCRLLANSIIGLSRTIMDGLEGEISEQQRTGLAAIHNSGRLISEKLNGSPGTAN